MIDQVDAFKKEVDEELQRERMQELWERYKVYIFAVAAAIVFGVGGWKFMESRQQAAAEKAGQAFLTAVRPGAKPEDTEKALAAISSGSGGYATLARMRLAAADIQAGRKTEALARLEAIAGEKGVDPLIADYARLQTAMLKIDSADWNEMSNRLRPLTLEGNPWRHGARELLGVAALKAERSDDAKAAFEQLLGDTSTPAGIAERARTMMAMLTERELSKSAAPAPAVETKPAKAAAPAGKDAKK
jgi:hypothetical protein